MSIEKQNAAKNISAIFSIIILISSCATNSSFKTETFYKRDLIMKINDREYEGIAIVDGESLKMSAEFKGDADLVTIRSCARSMEIEQAWRTRFFGSANKNKAKIDISLKYPLEVKQYCPINIVGWNHEGRHTFGFVVPKWDSDTVAQMICNGNLDNAKGIAVCQNFSNLLNEIYFQEPVKYKGDCNVERLNETDFRFSHNKGFCKVIFRPESVPNCSGENEKKCFFLIHMAYESIILKRQ